jgi:uncharacterized protein YkwD
MKRWMMCCALVSSLLATAAKAEEAKVVTANKPVVTTENKAVVVEQAKPQLHEHPTLLRMLRRNNDLRSRVGLRPHRINPQLTKAAQDHAVYMARTGNFSHYSNGGPQGRASRWGFRGMVRENIAWGQNDVQQAFHSWQNSGGHYASIVSGTTEAGFGYAKGADGRGYWVALYGN